MEHLAVRDREPERGERGLDEPRVLFRARRMADDFPVVEVDEQAYVVPRGPDAHVGEVAADWVLGARPPKPCETMLDTSVSLTMPARSGPGSRILWRARGAATRRWSCG